MEHKLHSEHDSGSEHFSISPSSSEDDEEVWAGELWDVDHLRSYIAEKRSRCVVLIDGYAIDVTNYLGEHVSSLLSPLQINNDFITILQPGGALLLRQFSIRSDDLQGPGVEIGSRRSEDASWAFHGGMNKHSRAARRRLSNLRIAKIELEKHD